MASCLYLLHLFLIPKTIPQTWIWERERERKLPKLTHLPPLSPPSFPSLLCSKIPKISQLAKHEHCGANGPPQLSLFTNAIILLGCLHLLHLLLIQKRNYKTDMVLYLPLPPISPLFQNPKIQNLNFPKLTKSYYSSNMVLCLSICFTSLYLKALDSAVMSASSGPLVDSKKNRS